MAVMTIDSVPAAVDAAEARARATRFTMSCEAAVGRLLAVLAAGLRPRARILELGTGVGVGTAWLVSGLWPRSDVTVTTVEIDRLVAATAMQGDWPNFVDFQVGDALELLGDLGSFDLIFADAQGGKWEGLERTIAALCNGGLLVVDDMTPQAWWDQGHQERQAAVRQTIMEHPGIVAIELDHGSGVIVAARRAEVTEHLPNAIS